MGEYCANVYTANSVVVFAKPVGAAMLAVGITYFAMALLVVYWIKSQERNAIAGSDAAVKSVIFPVFVQVLWVNALVNTYVAIIALTITFERSQYENVAAAWAFSLMWALQHALVEGVAFLLMRKGLGWNAGVKVLRRSFLWGIFTLFCKLGAYLFFDENHSLSLFFEATWEFVLLIFYLILWLAPRKRLFRRTAAIFYAKCWSIYRVFTIIILFLVYFPGTSHIGNCLYVFGILLTFATFEPLLVYYTLLQDSRWWQGMVIDTGGRGASFEAIRSPLAGIDLDLKSAQTLAASLDVMGDKIGGNTVRLLNFAYITLDKGKQLGSGSFSKVYRGTYRGKECAIKIIFTVDLTEDVIRRVATEAQILSQIEHPNIVRIFGVSVLPPSVCILLELCAFGSLADVVRGTGTSLGGSVAGPAQVLLHPADRFFLALGSARGLAALHSFSPDLCHRDIKSFNFLVDGHLNSKIADLELGVSEKLSGPAKKQPRARLSLSNGDDMSEEPGALAADEILANWSSPEVISGGQYTQAADIYAFGLVLWEILSGVVPFSNVKKQDDIRAKVVNGERPEIPAVFEESPSPFSHYVALLTRCWQHEAKFRPTADEVLADLECIWRNVCHNIAFDTDVMPDLDELTSPRSKRNFSIFGKGVNNTNSINSTNSTNTSAKISALDETTNNKLKEVLNDKNLDAFDRSGSAWILVSPRPPHVVLRTTLAFEKLSGLSEDSCLLQPVADIMSGSHMDPQEWSQLFQGLQVEQNCAHAIITLNKCTLNKNGASNMNTATCGCGEDEVYSQFSIHGFPIYKRAVADSDQVSTSASDTSNVSESPQITSGTSVTSGPSGPTRQVSVERAVSKDRNASQDSVASSIGGMSTSFRFSTIGAFMQQSNDDIQSLEQSQNISVHSNGTALSAMQSQSQSHHSSSQHNNPPSFFSVLRRRAGQKTGIPKAYYALLFSEIKEVSAIAKQQSIAAASNRKSNTLSKLLNTIEGASSSIASSPSMSPGLSNNNNMNNMSNNNNNEFGKSSFLGRLSFGTSSLQTKEKHLSGSLPNMSHSSNNSSNGLGSLSDIFQTYSNGSANSYNKEHRNSNNPPMATTEIVEC